MDVPSKIGFREWTDYDQPVQAAELYFYHTTDLPGVGEAKGHWDLRGNEDFYLGHVDVAGKSVFDCGVASGFNAFEMEKRGARVIGLDLDETRSDSMGLIPWFDFEKRFGHTFEQAIAGRKQSQRYLRNSFLYTRRLLKSQIPLYLGDIMHDALPGRADIALFGSILLHLHDPLGALYNVAKNIDETIIITDTIEEQERDFASDQAALSFRPALGTRGNPGTWHYMRPAWLKHVLAVVGFSKFTLHRGVAKRADAPPAALFSLVAAR